MARGRIQRATAALVGCGQGVGEFDLIERIARRAKSRRDVQLGIGDDCALVAPAPGYSIAISTDTLNESVHFRADDDPRGVGHKAAAVNLSDLAAMGAEPAWCTLALSMPNADSDWLDAFIDGFVGLLDQHAVALVGGDTTRGPRSITVTVHGLVGPKEALRRSAARIGDDIWVTGCLGDAAAALAGYGEGVAGDYLRARLQRPQPRVAAGIALRRHAHACIDVSDGLLADLGHVLRASGVGAEIELRDLPSSSALRDSVANDALRWNLQLSGGDDYELLFTAHHMDRREIERAVEHSATPVCRIGRIVEGDSCVLRDPAGQIWQPSGQGYQHFTERGR